MKTSTKHQRRTKAAAYTSYLHQLGIRCCDALDMNWNTYTWMQFRFGLYYLDCIIPHDAESRQLISYSRLYWAWWKNWWARLDEEFLANCDKIGAPLQRRAYYEQLHDASLLAKEATRTGEHMAISYAAMISRFNKELSNTEV
jgi:hypothetical protein